MRAFHKLFINLTILAIVTSILSCIREEFVPYKNEGKSLLVVIGFISPGENINVYVGKSQPFGKNDYTLSDFNEPNAIVTISNGEGRQQYLRPNATGSSIYSCSQQDFPVIPGSTYLIHVKNSFSEVTAQTTVPSKQASWKKTSLSGPEEYDYYTFTGSWDAISVFPEVNYGVSLITDGKNIMKRSNEGITNLNGNYSFRNEIFMRNATKVHAVLLTRDQALGEFSKKSDLTFDVLENLSSAGFSDVISGFKGVIPDVGNIKGGIGVFGSYLKDIRTINK